VRRSAYTRSATAIGLAIQADRPESYHLSEQLSRYFGVWREAESGSRMIFDPLFPRGLQLPPAGEPPLRINRDYSPVHNVGHFRFLECSHRGPDGSPTGEVTLWDEILFAFDPGLAGSDNLRAERVYFSQRAAQQRIEEIYECDSIGSISVTIENGTSGYSRVYRLGRWSQQDKPIQPVRRRKRPEGRAASSGT